MWKIKKIADADYGCEERLPGEKLRCLVTLENESGETRMLEAARNLVCRNLCAANARSMDTR